MVTATCWRCGGAPHDFGKLKPARPVCSVCAVELIWAALEYSELEDDDTGDSVTSSETVTLPDRESTG